MKEFPLEGLLVVSDIDNTLLREGVGLPGENVEAIRRFCALGGRFTLATGRNVPSTRRYLQEVPINAPAVLLNGGLLYDFAAERAVHAHYIDRERASAALAELLHVFPALGFEVMADDLNTYVVRSNAATAHHLQSEKFAGILADAEKVPGQWFKVLAAGDPSACLSAEKYCRSHFSEPSLVFMRTQDCYFEILPAQVSKGTALRGLCRHLDIPVSASYAIGDYDNDVEMLHAAGFAVVPANAPARVRRSADLVTGRCMEGGVAQFLNALIAFRTRS